MDRSGNVYVADDQAETVTKFSPSGTAKWTIGATPSPDPDAPRFGPRGEIFTLGEDGSILRLRVVLSGA